MENLVRDFSKRIWTGVASKVQKAVIFMDNVCAECLHWCGGTETLFRGGAMNIREFSAFESGSDKENKAVFVVSTPLIGKTAKTVEDIVKSSHFRHCVIITSVDMQVHEFAAGGKAPKGDMFQSFEGTLLRWMGQEDGSAEVVHLPIFAAPMFDNLFITPAFDMLFPVQHKDLPELVLQEGERPPTSLSDLHFYMFPNEYQTMIKMLVSSFRHLFHSTGCKEDVFALGSTSHTFSVQLSNLVSQHKAAYPKQASILFIDRTLDLIGPSSHMAKSVVDRLLGTLPALPGHCNNISIDMMKLCTATIDEDGDDIVYPGCLSPHNEEQSGNLLLSDIYKLELKEALKKIKHCLNDAINEEGLLDDVDQSEVGSEIEDLVKLFRQNAGAILYNSNLLQISLAVAQMSKDPSNKAWETLATTEKLLLQQLGDDHTSGILSRILNLIESADGSHLTFEDVAALLVFSSHSLREGTYESDELINAICNMLAKTPQDELPESLVHLCDSSAESPTDTDPEIFRETVQEMLRNIPQLGELHHFKNIKFSDIEPTSYQPLLSQVVDRILRPEKPELEPDVEHVSTGRKDLLKMGISMFKKISPPRPNDHPLLLIYVLGGITATEVHQVNRVINKHGSQKCQIILGSNRLISSTDIVDRTLFANNLIPDS